MRWCLELHLKRTHGIFTSYCPEQVTRPCEMSQKRGDGQERSLLKNSGPCTRTSSCRTPFIDTLTPASIHSQHHLPSHLHLSPVIQPHALGSHSHPRLYACALALGPIPLIHKHTPSEPISPTRSLSHHATHSCALLLVYTSPHSTWSTPVSTHTHNDI